MALQKEIIIISIVKGAGKFPGYTVVLQLKCWPESVPKTDPTIIDKQYSGYVKAKVKDKTLLQLVDEFFALKQIEMQLEIDKYLSEQALLNNPNLETKRAALEAALTG